MIDRKANIAGDHEDLQPVIDSLLPVSRQEALPRAVAQGKDRIIKKWDLEINRIVRKVY